MNMRLQVFALYQTLIVSKSKARYFVRAPSFRVVSVQENIKISFYYKPTSIILVSLLVLAEILFVLLTLYVST